MFCGSLPYRKSGLSYHETLAFCLGFYEIAPKPIPVELPIPTFQAKAFVFVLPVIITGQIFALFSIPLYVIFAVLGLLYTFPNKTPFLNS